MSNPTITSGLHTCSSMQSVHLGSITSCALNINTSAFPPTPFQLVSLLTMRGSFSAECCLSVCFWVDCLCADSSLCVSRIIYACHSFWWFHSDLPSLLKPTSSSTHRQGLFLSHTSSHRAPTSLFPVFNQFFEFCPLSHTSAVWFC